MDRTHFRTRGRARGLLALLSLLAWAPRAHAGEADPRATVVFFGDSLAAGYGLTDPSTESYPARVQELVDSAHLPFRVVNAGLSGETTAGGLRRIDWVLAKAPAVVVLELGGNDGLRGFAPEFTERNLQAIIDRIRSRAPGARIVLAAMRMPGSMGSDYAASFAALYPELARRNSIGIIPDLLDGVGGRPELNQPDGIHPTPEGARIVAATIWRTLRPILAGMAASH